MHDRKRYLSHIGHKKILELKCSEELKRGMMNAFRDVNERIIE